MEKIKSIIQNSIQVKQEIINNDKLLETIIDVIQIVSNALQNDRRIYFCGNGGSAADAQHLAAEFVGRFAMERVGLPAIGLTTDSSILTAVGNDYGFVQIFSRQLKPWAV